MPDQFPIFSKSSTFPIRKFNIILFEGRKVIFHLKNVSIEKLFI